MTTNPAANEPPHDPAQPTIRSMQDLLQIAPEGNLEGFVGATNIGIGQYLYRGVTDAINHTLTPVLYRDHPTVRGNAEFATPESFWSDYESSLLTMFRLRAPQFIDGPLPSSTFEWMTLARHHGVPTRLLDWSTNPMAALWFATDPSITSDAAIFRVNPQMGMCGIDVDDNFLTADQPPEYICAVTPAAIAARVSGQGSVFTIHNPPNPGSSFVPVEHSEASSSVRKFMISCDNKLDLRDELGRLGVNASTIYPGLDGLGQWVADRHRRNINEVVVSVHGPLPGTPSDQE